MITQDDERRYIIGAIEDGVKSDYWKLLKSVIQEWMDEEHKRLDYYKQSGISKDGDIDKYNRAVDRIRYLKKLLTINETIIDYHRSFLQKVKEKINSFIHKGESFFEEVIKR